MTRFEVMNMIIKSQGYKDYLEIGVFRGECIRQVIAENKDGVDPGVEGQMVPEVNYRMDSNQFFEQIGDKKYDFIFIDGLHHTEQVDMDIKNALDHLRDEGCIMLHDTNPELEFHTLVPRVSNIWHGDVYKSVLKYRMAYNYSFFTVDTDCGCTIICKFELTKYNKLAPEDFNQAMTSWDYFFKNKRRLLNLISTTNFNNWGYAGDI